MSAEAPPLWRQIGGQSVWGRRGFVKMACLWTPLAVLVSGKVSESSPALVTPCLAISASVACWCLASILANDLTDRQIDRAAGKQRWISHLPGAMGPMAVGALVGLGTAVVAVGASSLGPLVAYEAAVALGLLYSIRPVRLKQRGLAGPLAYSLSGALACVAVPWAWLGGDWRTLALLAPAVLLDKWVNLHFHQVVDYAEDTGSGVRTYAVAVGLTRARRTLQYAAALASASLLAVLIYVAMQTVWGAGAAVAAGTVVLAVGAHTHVSHRRSRQPSRLVRELPWLYLGLTYAVFRILPPPLLAREALLQPAMWVIAAAASASLLVESSHLLRYRHR